MYSKAVPIALERMAAALSHTGKVRRTNQDAWSYTLEAGLFVVCDGMGGAAGGEIASQTAVEAFLEHLCSTDEAARTTRGIAQAVVAANRRVQTRAVHERSLRGMGTTLVALISCGDNAVAIAHVGDSRCYRWRGSELVCLTQDHSLIAEQMRMGVLTAEQAEHSPMRNVITRAVGTKRSIEPEVQRLAVEPGDLFLLCSDGLTRELPDAAVAVLLGRGVSLEERTRSLIEAALRAGGRDNITAILVQMG